MTTETMTVPDVHCGHCKESIEGAVGALGVQAEVHIEERTVDLTYDEAAVSRAQIIEAIESQGYEVAP